MDRQRVRQTNRVRHTVHTESETHGQAESETNRDTKVDNWRVKHKKRLRQAN